MPNPSEPEAPARGADPSDDERALVRMFVLHRIRRIRLESDAADDITQEALRTILAAGLPVGRDDRTAVIGWHVRNATSAHTRALNGRERRRQALLREPPPAPEATAEEAMEEIEHARARAAAFARAVEELPGMFRVYVDARIAGRTLADVALEQDIPQGTAGTRAAVPFAASASSTTSCRASSARTRAPTGPSTRTSSSGRSGTSSGSGRSDNDRRARCER